MKHCLLVIPRHFYSFEKHITTALELKGYQVTVSNDEYPRGTMGKILGKLQIPLVFSLTCNYIKTHFLKDRAYDLVLIFKGRGMSKRLLQEMKKSAGWIVGYNWDSFILNRAPLKWLQLTSRYCTFDYRDADRHSLPLLELFTSGAAIEKKEIKYEISAIVRNHSKRLSYVDKVLTILKPQTSYIYIYEHSLITFLYNFIRCPKLYLKYRRHIHFKALKYDEYSSAIMKSEFTVDFAHYTQTGITMRCFEAASLQTKLITNNPFIVKSDHFSASDYLLFQIKEDASVLYDAYTRTKKEKMTAKTRGIDRFLEELIGQTDEKKPRIC